MTRWKRNCRANVEYESMKEKSSFVSKIYETRSTGPVKDVSRKVNLNTLNLRKNIYLKKVQTSFIKVPIKRPKKSFIDEESTIVYKNKSPKEFKKNVTEDTACAFIGEAFNDLFASNFKMNLINSNGIDPDIPIEDLSADIEQHVPAAEKHKHLTENGVNEQMVNVHNEQLMQNSIKESLSESITEELINNKKSITNGVVHHTTDNNKTDIIKNDSLDDGNKSIDYSSVETSESQNTPSVATNSIKKKRRRKNKVDILLNACCEFKTPTVEKRQVKKPLNYSPDLNKRKKLKDKIERKDTQTSAEFGYTLSGRLKKKPGRQPKYKGPIYHFLDVPHDQYLSKSKIIIDSSKLDSSKKSEDIPEVNNKEESNKETLFEETVQENNSEVVPDFSISSSCNVDKDNIETSESTPIIPPPSSFSIITNTESKPNSISLSRDCEFYEPKKECLKSIDSLEPVKLDYLDHNIISILGCRCDKNRKEYLVLFDNGTSNWIYAEETSPKLDTISRFYIDPEQDLNVLQRTLPSKIIHTFSGDTEENDDNISDVFSSSYSGDSSICMSDIHKTLENCLVNSTHQSYLTPIDDHTCTKDNNFLFSNDLSELCKFVLSSAHVRLYPCEMTKELVVKNEKEFVHIYLKRFQKNVKSDDSFNTLTCQELIYVLEDLAVNNDCDVVIINGIDHYFSFASTFERMLKVEDLNENAIQDQEISMLRYLVQTIRNFSKPIVAVIRKSVCGLPAALLSLFDMVFDEHFAENGCVSASSILGKEKHESPQKFMFPRLTGLTDFNEAKMMGEKKRITLSQEDFFTGNLCVNSLSTQLKSSLKYMKHNTSIKVTSRTRSQSLDNSLPKDLPSPKKKVGRKCSFSEQPTKLGDLKERVNEEIKRVKLELCELKSAISIQG